MNLKNACIITLVISIAAIALMCIGHGFIYIPIITRLFSLYSTIRNLIWTAGYLMQFIGFLVFLIPFIRRSANSLRNMRPCFIFAGILILLGTLINMINTARIVVPLHMNFELFRFRFYMVIFGLNFFSGLCLGLFTFTHLKNSSLSKFLGVTTLIITICYFALTVINGILYQPWNSTNSTYTIGSLMMTLGSLLHQAAILLFLFVWLKQKPWPPTASVGDISPDPLPTLSTQAPLPE